MVNLNYVCLLFIIFQLKHFWLDFWWQPPFMWRNKGTYGHWGGVAHSLFHAMATALIALLFTRSIVLAFGLSFAEYIVHYHVDWAKMNINARRGWKCNTHNEFWQLTGFDQLLHQLTYVALTWAILVGVAER